jgi:CIC family chloride channel protein
MQPETIYEALSRQEGIHLPAADTLAHVAQRRVAQVMRGATDVLPSTMTVREALARAAKTEPSAWPVTDERGVVGVLSRESLELAAKRSEEDKPLSELLTGLDFPHVHTDHPLHMALERMGAAKLDLLPVVSRANIRLLLGVVLLSDILNSFGVAPHDVHGGEF